MKKLLCLMLCLPLLAFAQGKDKETVKFIDASNWQAVLSQAKAENKLIFLDAYATWCGPCKQMDKEVYPDEFVGKVLNAKFISVKVQMDATKDDNEKVRGWYTDAKTLGDKYRITSFPSFLFFSPGGQLLHRDTGYKKANDFVQVANDAASANRQLYRVLIENYQHGRKDYSVLPFLAGIARELRERELPNILAQDYLNNYLYKQKSDAQLFNKTDLEFIGTYTKSPKEKGFNLFFDNRAKVNQLTREKYAEGVIQACISKAEIDPYADVSGKGAAPDWVKVAQNVKQYGPLGEEAYLRAKTYYHGNKQDKKSFAPAALEYLTKYPEAEGAWNLNNFAWMVFEATADKPALNAALAWSKKSMDLEQQEKGKVSSAAMDTYANILHRLGRSQEAASWEEKALADATANKRENDIKLYTDTIAKMKGGQPTWPQT